jgi:hypothetical protein
MTTDNVSPSLQRLAAILRNEQENFWARHYEIGLYYYTRNNCEISIRIEDPAHMIAHLRAAFDPSNTLLARFNRPHHQGRVAVEIPGEFFDDKTKTNKEACLVRLSFEDAKSPATLSFNEMNAIPEGPTLEQFITALKKAGNDWCAVDFQPPPKPHLRLVPRPAPR